MKERKMKMNRAIPALLTVVALALIAAETPKAPVARNEGSAEAATGTAAPPHLLRDDPKAVAALKAVGVSLLADAKGNVSSANIMWCPAGDPADWMPRLKVLYGALLVVVPTALPGHRCAHGISEGPDWPDGVERRGKRNNRRGPCQP